MSARRRLAAVTLAGLVPWVVVRGADGSLGLVHAFGLVNPAPAHVTTVTAYVFVHTRGLPEYLLAWPVSTALWLVALASAGAGAALGREDRRLTGGLLVLGGASLLPVALAVGRPGSILAVPVGTVGLWAVAWWGYGADLRRIAAVGSAREP